VSRRSLGPLVAIAVAVFLAFVPQLGWSISKVFTGPLNSPGTLQLLATCLVFAGLALTYDLLFGFTGLLSFGHALYFAVGVYLPAIAMTRWGWGFWASIALTVATILVLPLVVGAISLRVSGIAFAMVTLAFAQVAGVIAIQNPYNLTGGEEGFATDFRKLPEVFVGIANTKNLYWLALAYVVLVTLVVHWSLESSPGRVWQAIRDNEQRVLVLGLRARTFKLISFGLGSTLAGVGGIVFLLLTTGPHPAVTAPSLTLTLLIMAVLGGSGTKWGALVGGVLYTYLNERLGAIGESASVQDLHGVLRVPLSQPLFLLGTFFILVVFFMPGGIVRLDPTRWLRGRTGRSGSSARPLPTELETGP
jgi:branched-chain amino acid transport system permease protein